MKLEIKPLITVVDSAYLSELYEAQSGKTYSLMIDQIRSASLLIMNKIDRLEDSKRVQIKSFLTRMNPHAHMVEAVKCDVDLTALLQSQQTNEPKLEQCDHSSHHHCDHDHSHTHSHTSHEHVTVYTHYFQKPIDSVEFEQFLKDLPREIYRAKGVLSFTDTSKRFLFQYAYRESDFMAITPQGDIPDVAVFIGEHFDQQRISEGLRVLEGLI
ncbi:putative metal chaperone YciC [compost metagenome]